jgi:hypothetical protein
MESLEFTTPGTIVGYTLPKLNYQKSTIVYFFRYNCEKSSGQYLGLIVMSHWFVVVWIRIREVLVILPLSVHVENHICLSRDVLVISATRRIAMRIVAGVGDLVQRTRDGQAQVRYSIVGRSGGQVMSCAVCTMHKETNSMGFLIEPQNQGRRVSQFEPQNCQLWFSDLGLKITTTISLVGP